MGHDWQIEPAGVAGVLHDVDNEGEALDTVRQTMSTAKSSGATLLEADDRTTLTAAWETFYKDRVDVPGKLMWVLNERSSEVSSAVMDINTGTVEMGDNLEQNRRTAKERWSIDGAHVYNADGNLDN